MIKKIPINLIKNRFDIKVKYLYAQSLEFNKDISLYKFLIKKTE